MTITRHSVNRLILFIALLNTSALQSQQTNFIHIQSDANQPFAVQLKGQNYSSSVTGYLVIPQVPIGDHTLVIGFAGNNFPEYSFQCTMADKPRGFSLKQGVDNSWSLFDMVDFTVIRGAIPIKETVKAVETKVPEPVTEKKADTDSLSTPERYAETKTNTSVTLPTPSNASNISKTAGGAATTTLSTGVLAATAATGLVVNKSKQVEKQSSIQKIFDKASINGIDQVYIVVNNGKADTVALFIPVIKDDLNKQEAFNLRRHPIAEHKDAEEAFSKMLLSKSNRLRIPTK